MLHDVREEVHLRSWLYCWISPLQRLHPEKVPQDSVHYNLILSEEDKYAYPLAFPILNISETEVWFTYKFEFSNLSKKSAIFFRFFNNYKFNLKGGKQIWTMDGRFLISTAWREKILRRLLIKKWKQQVLRNQTSRFLILNSLQYRNLGENISKFMRIAWL